MASYTRIDHFVVNGDYLEPPEGLKVLNWQDGSVLRFLGFRREVSPTELIIHETCTTSAEQTVDVLIKRKLGVHFIVDAEGLVYQHGDLFRDKLSHASQHNISSVGVEIVNPYYPQDNSGPWLKNEFGKDNSISAPWAHKGWYVVPTLAQLEAVTKLIDWITSAQSGLMIPARWIGLDDNFKFSMSTVTGADLLHPGIYAHHYFAHADGSFPVLYAWMRIIGQLTPMEAYTECMARTCDVRWHVDVSDLMGKERPLKVQVVEE